MEDLEPFPGTVGVRPGRDASSLQGNVEEMTEMIWVGVGDKVVM